MYNGHRERHDAGFVQHVAATFPDVYGGVMLGRSADAEDAEDAAKIAELRGLLAMANSAEQVGYYSDFDPDSGSWSSRGGVTEPEFARSAR